MFTLLPSVSAVVVWSCHVCLLPVGREMVLLMELNCALRCLGSSQRQAAGWHETDEPPFPAPGTENYKHNSTSSCLTTFWSRNVLLVETLLASLCKQHPKKKQICQIFFLQSVMVVPI